MSFADTTSLKFDAGRTLPPWLETLGVFLACLLGYVLLLSQLPVDDVAAYFIDLRDNKLMWDVGHLWAEPIGLFAYHHLQSHMSILAVLEMLNVISCAAAMTIFFRTLRLAGNSLLRAVLAVMLVAVSFNLISLGPTAHIKLLVFPVLALAIHYAVAWELARQDDTKLLVAAGASLGIASTLLVSVLPMGPFIALLVFVVARRRGAGLRQASASTAIYLIAMGVCGLLSLLAAYAIAVETGTTQRGLMAFVAGGVADKEAVRPGFYGLVEVPFRVIYSVVYNFAFLPDIGSLGRAAMRGLVADLSPYYLRLAREGVVALITLASLLSIFWFSLRAAWSRKGLVLPFGFLLGATAFAAYWNVNDPEHWFQFTMPIVLLAAVNCPRRVTMFVLAVWMPLLAINNLGLYGIHKARFDLPASAHALHETIGINGLYVGYAGYPGEPDSSLIATPDIERLRIDNMFYASNDAAQTLAIITARIDATLARGGRVFVFRLLDEGDWRGPILGLALSGFNKTEISAALHARYKIAPETKVGSFPAHEILGLAP
ncbi:MAG: hypothetical protein JWN23_3147 [Rhodocyclales bacterium]|nr:hypothetical protein [Rhodocyclales bacterium]